MRASPAPGKGRRPGTVAVSASTTAEVRELPARTPAATRAHHAAASISPRTGERRRRVSRCQAVRRVSGCNRRGAIVNARSRAADDDEHQRADDPGADGRVHVRTRVIRPTTVSPWTIGTRARASPATTSAISTTRREPSSPRPRWTTTSIDRVRCWRTATSGQAGAAWMIERLQPVQGVERAVGVARRPGAVVAGVQRLDERQHLRSAHLADDQAVGPQPQRRANELLEGHGVRAVRRRRPGLQPDQVIGCGSSSAVSSMVTIRSPGAVRPSTALSSEVLPDEVGSAHDDVAPSGDGDIEHGADRPTTEGVERERAVAEATHAQAGPVGGDRGDHGAHPRAVREPGVDHRRRAVEAASEWSEDPFDDHGQV